MVLSFWIGGLICCVGQLITDFFLSHGETTVLPTFYCNLTLQQMLQGLENVKTAIAQGAGNLGGLYMEGPYMSGEGSN